MNADRETDPLLLPTCRRRSIYVNSVAVTTLAFFVGVGVPCWFAFNLAWGVGLGAMCAFWGGPGFGVMVGGARVALLEERGYRPQPVVASEVAAAGAGVVGGAALA